MTFSAAAAPPIASVRLADCTPQPWRNGGGVTRELLIWTRPNRVSSEPTGSDWSVRVSVADIAHDGPFSSFPGIDRYFAVLEGKALNSGLMPGERRSAATTRRSFSRASHPSAAGYCKAPRVT